MRSCFRSWFDVVLERRVMMGKARALSDWRYLSRAWNAWKYQTQQTRFSHLEKEHQHEVLNAQRKLNMAVSHHRKCALRGCFTQWQVFTASRVKMREAEQQDMSVRDKMAAFLSTGQQILQQKKLEQEETTITATQATPRESQRKIVCLIVDIVNI